MPDEIKRPQTINEVRSTILRILVKRALYRAFKKGLMSEEVLKDASPELREISRTVAENIPEYEYKFVD